MSKIRAEHLERGAYVYIRQSTLEQVREHRESQRRQYALAERAQALGWQEVVTIDEDLGRSGGGQSRPGFERLLSAICEERVGAVFSIEASRLARNGRDWHTLLELCAVVGSLLVDEDGIYDPRQPNDRLLLGMKGTLSEMELSTFRGRAQAALEQKAKRGELYTCVAVGYVRGEGDRIEKDPDDRVREAIAAVFYRFGQAHSVRQVMLQLREDRIKLPHVSYEAQGRVLQWRVPCYSIVHRILTNPVYAGAYAFGRTRSRVRIEQGRKRLRRGEKRPQQAWQVLITNHHEGYIAWSRYEENQRVIADNANMHGEVARGAAREGQGLLAGMLRCGHCGRKLQVLYRTGRINGHRYRCRVENKYAQTPVCEVGFGGYRVDEAISEVVLEALQPLGVEAALQAIEQAKVREVHTHRHLELAVEQARYDAQRAQRQYELAEPENRMVARELERRWNERLEQVAHSERELSLAEASEPQALTPEEAQRLRCLGEDLASVWHHPQLAAQTRKRIVRLLLKEIVVRVEGTEIQLVLHWHGGDHTALRVARNRIGEHRHSTDRDLIELIRELAREIPDSAIVGLLNRLGKRTGQGNTWSESRLRALRNNHGIEVYREGERAARGEVNLQEAAQILGMRNTALLRLISAGRLKARQACKGAPWIISRSALEEPSLRARIASPAKHPVLENEKQLALNLQ